MKEIKTFAFLVLSVLVLCKAQIKIFAPDFAKDLQLANQDNIINFTIANFGDIPYGKSIIGPVIQAQPSDACSEITNVDERNSLADTLLGKPILLIKRGGCNFVQKVKNAQNAGAKLVIIGDNIANKYSMIYMADDGTGSSVKIPSVFIQESDRLKLIQVMQSTTSQLSELNQTQQDLNLFLVVQFAVQETEIVELNLYLNLPSNEGLGTIHELYSYLNYFGDKVKIKPVYQFVTCLGCMYSKQSNDLENCLGGGKYCGYDPDGPYGVIKGRDLVEEQLRQLCLFQYSEKKWWSYMKKFSETCGRPQEYSYCSSKIMDQLEIDTDAVKKCYDESFDQYSDEKHELQKNFILDDQINQQQAVLVWPGASINNITYHGNFIADDIIQTVCAYMKNPTDDCKQLINENILVQPAEEEGSKTSIFKILSITLLILGVLFAGVILIYKRIVKREMSSEMNAQVNEMVSQYLKFHENKIQKQKV